MKKNLLLIAILLSTGLNAAGMQLALETKLNDLRQQFSTVDGAVSSLSYAAGIPTAALNTIAGNPLEAKARKLHAQSLTAKSAKKFRELQLAAAQAEKSNRNWQIAGAASWGTNVAMQGRRLGKSQGVKTALKVALGASLSKTGLAGLSTVDAVLANKRYKQHLAYANNAETLYALLQSPSFKKKMGVTRWTVVSQARIKTANMAMGLGIGFSFSHLVLQSKNPVITELLSLSGVAARKLAHLRSYRKVEAPGLEKAFNEAIKNGIKDYAATDSKEQLAADSEERAMAL